MFKMVQVFGWNRLSIMQFAMQIRAIIFLTRESRRTMIHLVVAMCSGVEYDSPTPNGGMAPQCLAVSYHFGKYPVNYNFVMTKPVKSDSLAFQDSNIDVKFDISRRAFNFVIANKTDDGVSVDWDQASFIDTDGKTHKALYGGLGGSRDGPRLVPPGAKLEVVEFPGDWVVGDALGGCKSDWEALFPAGDEAKAFSGKVFSFYLPLRIKDASKGYLFSFSIQIQ